MSNVVDTVEVRAGTNSKQLFGPQNEPVMVQNQGTSPVTLSNALTTSQSISLAGGQSLTWPADTPCFASTIDAATIAIGVGATAGPVSQVNLGAGSTVNVNGGTIGVVNPATGDTSKITTSDVLHWKKTNYISASVSGVGSSAPTTASIGTIIDVADPYEITYFTGQISASATLTNNNTSGKSTSVSVTLYGSVVESGGTAIVASTQLESISSGPIPPNGGQKTLKFTLTSFSADAPLSATVNGGNGPLLLGGLESSNDLCVINGTINPALGANSTTSYKLI